MIAVSMKAKTSQSKSVDVRWKPIDEKTYPVGLTDGDYFYWRVWCSKFFIVYEKYLNGVKLGHLILPEEKELFNFKSVETYVEKINSGEVMCELRKAN